MDPNQEPFQLLPLKDEDAKVVLEAFENFKHAHGVDISARPFINGDGTIGCEVRFFKKVALVPKEEGFQQEDDNGGNASAPVAA